MPSECDLLVLGPEDATRRLLAATLMSEGFGVVATGDFFEARQASNRGHPRIVITYFPDGFDSSALRLLLGTDLLNRASYLSLEDPSPEGIGRLVAAARRFCEPQSPLL